MVPDFFPSSWWDFWPLGVFVLGWFFSPCLVGAVYGFLIPGASSVGGGALGFFFGVVAIGLCIWAIPAGFDDAFHGEDGLVLFAAMFDVGAALVTVVAQLVFWLCRSWR